MKKNAGRIVIAIIFLALYALAGWHQRGWVDWPGLGTVALLVAAVAAYVPDDNKKEIGLKR